MHAPIHWAIQGDVIKNRGDRIRPSPPRRVEREERQGRLELGEELGVVLGCRA